MQIQEAQMGWYRSPGYNAEIYQSPAMDGSWSFMLNFKTT